MVVVKPLIKGQFCLAIINCKCGFIAYIAIYLNNVHFIEQLLMMGDTPEYQILVQAPLTIQVLDPILASHGLRHSIYNEPLPALCKCIIPQYNLYFAVILHYFLLTAPKTQQIASLRAHYECETEPRYL